MNKQQEQQRGTQANRIINDPLYVEAWDSVRNRLLAVMEAAKTDEATLRAKTMLGLLHDVKGHFERVMANGKIASEEIRLEDEAKKRKFWQRVA